MIGGMISRRMVVGRFVNGAVVRAPWLWPVLRKPLRAFFDAQAPSWDEQTGAGSAERLAPLAAGLLEVSPAPERALEIGTGTGVGALLIAREFPQARVRGIDVSEEMIRRAQDRIGLDPEGRVVFRVADASDLPWEDASFDLVAEINMPPFFDEIARVLRPGGFVVHAASSGPATPFWTSPKKLRSGFDREGVEEVRRGRTADGDWWAGRKATR
jgi:SAM-dependent methyltransferase